MKPLQSEDLAARIQRIEDIEVIREVKARFVHHNDGKGSVSNAKRRSS